MKYPATFTMQKIRKNLLDALENSGIVVEHPEESELLEDLEDAFLSVLNEQLTDIEDSYDDPDNPLTEGIEDCVSMIRGELNLER